MLTLSYLIGPVFLQVPLNSREETCHQVSQAKNFAAFFSPYELKHFSLLLAQLETTFGTYRRDLQKKEVGGKIRKEKP